MGSSDSLGVAGFTGVHPGGRRVLSVSLSVVVVIQGRWVHFGAPCDLSGSFKVSGFIVLGDVGAVQRRYVDCGAPRGSSGSFGVAEGCALGVVGFVRRH